LTGVTVSVEDVAASKWNFLVRNTNVVTQPDNTGKRELRVNIFTVVFDSFRFAFDY
jgi:hypothetical protein